MIAPGMQFQSFVAMLERTLNGADGVEIRSPMRLRDRDTGRLREHDVVIVRTTHHDQHLTAVECRDRSRNVTVNDVEAFANKCQRTGVHHGVIVAAHGFANTARVKARAQNISCVDLAEAERFPWVGSNVVTVRTLNFLASRCDLVLDDPNKTAKPPYQLLDASGEGIADSELYALIDESMTPEEREMPPSTPRSGWLVTDGGGMRVRDGGGRMFAVERLRLRYSFEFTETSGRFSLHAYRSGSSDLEIAFSQGGSADTALTMIKSDALVTGYITHPTSAKPWVKVGDLPARRTE